MLAVATQKIGVSSDKRGGSGASMIVNVFLSSASITDTVPKLVHAGSVMAYRHTQMDRSHHSRTDAHPRRFICNLKK